MTLALPPEGVERLLARIDELRGELTDLALGFLTARATTVLQLQLHAIVFAEASTPAPLLLDNATSEQEGVAPC